MLDNGRWRPAEPIQSTTHHGHRASRLGAHCLRVCSPAWWGLYCLILAGVLAGAALAQPVPRDFDTEEADGPLVPAPREYVHQLEVAQEALAGGQPADAVTTLGGWLQDQGEASLDEDYLLDDPTTAETDRISLRVLAERILLGMNPAAREVYQLQYGATADQLLKQALDERREDLLVAVGRQFFATDAGRRATWMLARREFDQGRPGAALRWLVKLDAQPTARAALEPQLSLMLASCWNSIGRVDRGREVLGRLLSEQPDAELLVGGVKRRVFAEQGQSNADRAVIVYRQQDGRVDGASFEWKQPLLSSANGWDLAESWLNAHGVPSRNPAVKGGVPLLSMQWELPVAVEPSEQAKLESMTASYREQGIAALPILSPLVVGNWLIMRSADAVFGVDFRTGKRIWPYPWDGTSLVGRLPQVVGREMDDTLSLRLRVWEDALTGQISSDGERIFVVQPEHTGATASEVQQAINAPFATEVDPQINELVALELKTQGKLAWSVGGLTGGAVPELKGAFFLGAPLAVRGQLFAAVELNSEIRLVALDPVTGKMLWSQQLAQVGERPIQLDWVRRLAGVSLTYADGLIICPLHVGVTAAIDIDTRQVRWVFSYGDIRELQAGGRAMTSRTRMAVAANDPQNRWFDAAPRYAEGRVVLTPADARQWYCLDAVTGKLLGAGKPKDETIYVVGLHRGNVVLAGKHAITAWDPVQDRPVWEVALPADAVLTGRGFVADGHLFQPISSPALLEIDLDKGELVRKIETVEVLGNLTSIGDYIVSQRPDKLQVFYRRDRLQSLVAENLQQNQKDPWSLQYRGLLRRDEGDSAGALSDLRAAWEQVRAQARNAADRSWENYLSRELVTTIIQTLEQASKDGQSERFDDSLWQEAARLVTREADRGRLTRIRAEHARLAGDWETAWQDLLSLVDQLAAQVAKQSDLAYPRDTIRPDWSIRRDRWLRARLNEVFRQADAATQTRLAAALDTRRSAMLATPRSREVWADIMADLSIGDDVVMAACRDQLERGQLLAAEQRLLQLARSDRPSSRGWAANQLARLYINTSHVVEAAQQIEILRAAELAGVACDGNLTGRELAEQLTAMPAFAVSMKAWSDANRWPDGQIVSRPIPATEPANGMGVSVPTVIFRSGSVAGSDPQARLAVVQKDASTNFWQITDALGNVIYETPLGPAIGNRGQRSTPRASHWQSLGHLGLVDVERRGEWMAFDWLTKLDESVAPGTNSTWTFNPPAVNDSLMLSGEAARLRQQQEREIHDAWGSEPELMDRVSGRNFDQLTSRGICLQTAGQLFSVDPLRREVIWKIQGVEDGSWIWGDEDWVWVQRPTATKAQRLRRLDGQVVEQDVSVPDIARRWFVSGRYILTWENQVDAQAAPGEPPARELQWWDTLAKSPAWKLSIAPRTRGTLAGPDRLVMVDPAGHAQVIEVSTSRTLSKYDFPLQQQTFDDLKAVVWGDHLLVCCNQPPIRTANQQSLWVNGWLQCFDVRTGAPRWPTPAYLEQANLVLVQPSAVPALTLFRHQPNRTNSTKAVGVQLMCLDVRDGRLVLDEATRSDNAYPTQFEVDPGARTMNIRLRTSKEIPHFQLQFTDQPRPPGAPPQPGANDGARRGQPDGSTAQVFSSVIGAIGKNLAPITPPGIPGISPSAGQAGGDGADETELAPDDLWPDDDDDLESDDLFESEEDE